MSQLIAPDLEHGDGLRLGELVIIEPDVKVGNRVTLGHRVTLKAGTRIGNDTVIGDHCITTGACWIGNNVAVRTGAIISKANIIEDWVFIGPGVITNHTKHVTHGRPGLEAQQLLTVIGQYSIIGTQTTMLAGVTIGPHSIIGGGSNVVKDIGGYGVYFGSPCKWASVLPKEYTPKTYPAANPTYMTDEILGHLKDYMPDLVVKEMAA